MLLISKCVRSPAAAGLKSERNPSKQMDIFADVFLKTSGLATSPWHEFRPKVPLFRKLPSAFWEGRRKMLVSHTLHAVNPPPERWHQRRCCVHVLLDFCRLLYYLREGCNKHILIKFIKKSISASQTSFTLIKFLSKNFDRIYSK